MQEGRVETAKPTTPHPRRHHIELAHSPAETAPALRVGVQVHSPWSQCNTNVPSKRSCECLEPIVHWSSTQPNLRRLRWARHQNRHRRRRRPCRHRASKALPSTVSIEVPCDPSWGASMSLIPIRSLGMRRIQEGPTDRCLSEASVTVPAFGRTVASVTRYESIIGECLPLE